MVHLDPYIEILADPSRSLEIEDLQEESMWKKFTRYEGRGRPNFGYSYSFYWIRFQVHNTSSIDEWLLELDSPKINTLQLYQYDADTDQWTMKQTGNGYPFLERDVLHRNLVYKIHLPINEVETIYLRVISGSSKQVPLTLWQPSAHNYKSQVEYTFFGTIFGISLVMALYNLFLYFSVGDRNYLFYVLFVVLNTGLFLSDTGLGYQFIWPELVLWAGRSVTAFMLLSNIGAILFAVHFLETKRYAPRIDIIMKVHMSLVIAVFLVCLLEIVSDSRWFDWRVINLYITVASAAAILITITLLMIAAIRALHSGYRPARYFLIAWGVFTLGVISSLLVDVGILPLIPITKYAWQVSTLLEMVLLSFALGDRIRLMREEKEAAVLESQRSQQMVMESL